MSKPRVSAGLLMYRRAGGELQVLLAHPGGPFFRNKDEGAWSIPKGEVGPGEDPLAAAVREFGEEIGLAPTGPFLALTPVKQRGGQARPHLGLRGGLRLLNDLLQQLHDRVAPTVGAS